VRIAGYLQILMHFKGMKEGNVGAAEGGEAAAKQEQELQPVDLDVNLVENLLASYAGQQGLPGPASNLAGLMGISLPDNKDNFS
jgi:hypothetical protein